MKYFYPLITTISIWDLVISVVHHINHQRDDNRLENLELLISQKAHVQRHVKGRKAESQQFKTEGPMFDEIKFRLFDKDRGITREYSLSQLINTSFRRGCFEFRGRSTGLKDNNDKPIFEGDIVKVSYGEGLKIYQHQVKWDDLRGPASNGGWIIDIGNRYGIGLSENSVFIAGVEIIGNIYENPELFPKYESNDK